MPDGSRYLYVGGAWARPYVIPDAETEERLVTRLLQLLGIVLGIATVVPLLGRVTGLSQSDYGRLGMVAFMVLAMCVARQLLFDAELCKLERGRPRLGLGDHPWRSVERQQP